jgi:hypothetical protein
MPATARGGRGDSPQGSRSTRQTICFKHLYKKKFPREFKEFLSRLNDASAMVRIIVSASSSKISLSRHFKHFDIIISSLYGHRPLSFQPRLIEETLKALLRISGS